MNRLAYLTLAMFISVAIAENVNCWGDSSSCVSSVTRFDRLRVHTLLISTVNVTALMNASSSADNGTVPGTVPGKVLLSGVHFPNVDGQPPGKLSQLQFRGSFSQLTGCKCPAGNCEGLLKSCEKCKDGKTSSCTVEALRSCVHAWLTPTSDLSCKSNFSLSAQDLTFLQMTFGGPKNTIRGTSASADGAVGMPGWVYRNPASSSSTPAPRNLAFANNKALTALVQIDGGQFVFAEWNWEKSDARCRSNSKNEKIYYDARLNPCGAGTENPCINNLVCAVTFDYCLLSMMLSNTAKDPGVVSPECDLVISLAWQGTDSNKRFCSSQNQMFSKFNALGLGNLLQSTLTRTNDVTSDIESSLKSG